MARRAADDNYDSDLEEEEQQEAAQQQQKEQEGAGGEEAAAAMKVLAEAEKKLKELQEQEERLKVGGAGLFMGVGQGGRGSSHRLATQSALRQTQLPGARGKASSEMYA
jgi:hypothetical protein